MYSEYIYSSVSIYLYATSSTSIRDFQVKVSFLETVGAYHFATKKKNPEISVESQMEQQFSEKSVRKL